MITIKKKIFIFLFTIIILIFFIYLVFRRDFNNIITLIKNITVFDVIILLIIGSCYQLLEAFGCYVLIKSQKSQFTYHQAIELTLLGMFSNIATSTAGTIPMQSYYLYKRGIKAGKGIGLIILDSIFHKFAVFIYASIMLLFNIDWLYNTNNLLFRYILVGYVVYLLIIVGLILICSWSRIQDLLLWLMKKLPDNEKWQKRKADWKDNLAALYQESRVVFKSFRTCLKVILADFVKLFFTYTIPLFCFQVVKCGQLSFIQIQVLSSIMLLITGILPNVAGMGPAEVSFLLVFAPYMGIIEATSAMIIYRLATYFYPFVVSIFAFLKLEKELLLQ